MFVTDMLDDQEFSWRVGSRFLKSGQLPVLMGILNVTPDSFSDGGQYASVADAVTHALKLIQDGADIIDIGGESTRPGAASVSLQEELDRTIPVIEAVFAETGIPISIDTTKSQVAREALQAGACIVNDISGMTFDVDMLPVCAQADAAVCVMHIQGTPQTMQQNPMYSDVVGEVTEFLQQRLQACLQAGMDVNRICLDPGIGFGKTAEHNLQLMHAIAELRESLQRPILIGHSRKRFLSRLLGRPVEERLAGTVGVSLALFENGADVLRVHDVQATRDALLAWSAVRAN